MLAQERGVVLTVLAPNREPVEASAENTTFYQGTLPVSGRYAIDLTLSPGSSESDYNLNIELENPPQPTPTETPTEIPTEIPTETPTDIPTATPTNTPLIPFPDQNQNNQPTDDTSNPDVNPTDILPRR